MRDLLLAAAGFLLFVLLFTEEFQRLMDRGQDFARKGLGSRLLVYSLAAAAVLVGMGLILNALFVLVRLMWSYE